MNITDFHYAKVMEVRVDTTTPGYHMRLTHVPTGITVAGSLESTGLRSVYKLRMHLWQELDEAVYQDYLV